MGNEYFSYIEEDPALYDAVNNCLPELKDMSPVQVEKLIFFLKSLHSYYPKSENHTVFYGAFTDKLERLKSSEEQLLLQRRSSISAMKAVIICVGSGMLLAASLAAFVSDEQGYGILLALLAIAGIFTAVAKFWDQSISISKEQDRKYFLASIREAKACNELDWAGLFTFHKASKTGPHSDEDIKRCEYEAGELSAKLRAALYNDEFFQYSPASLKEVESRE